MSEPNYWVIIPAAGSGSRLHTDAPKQYLSLLGKTIIEHTLEVFLDNSKVKETTVCLAADDQYFSTLGVADKVALTQGGESRSQSVLNGLISLKKKASDDDWVLVHDAARPCFTQTLLHKIIHELSQDEIGGILAVPAKDTLKQADMSLRASAKPRIQTTLNRAKIWQAQTPQMFRYKLLKDALSNALAARVDVTDEASAIEWSGLQPKLIEGDARNIKITTADDLPLAEFLLGRKGSTINL